MKNSLHSLPTNRRILIGLGLVFALSGLFILSITTFVKLSNIEDPYSGLNISIFTFLCFYTVLTYLVIVRFGINKIGRESLREIGWSFNNWQNEFAVGVFGALVSAMSLYLFGFLLGIWTWQDFYALQLQYSFDQRILFLLIGLSAAFIEESLFRGYLQPALSSRLGIICGIFITSVVFALYHLKFGPFAFGGKMILGIIYGVMRGRDNSLLRPAVAHAGTWLLIGSA